MIDRTLIYRALIYRVEPNRIRDGQTAPVPHEPSDKEASCDEVLVSGAAHQSCKDEHRLVLKGVAAGMCKLWKAKVAIAKKAATKLRVAQAGDFESQKVQHLFGGFKH